MPLSRHLWQAKIAHRVLPDESSGGQTFWLLNPDQLEECRAALEAWQQGARPQGRQRTSGRSWSQRLKKAPVTLVIMSLALLVTLAFEILLGPVVFLAVSFTPLSIESGQVISQPLSATLASGHYWRLITPIFLHFGWMHLVFNLLWAWILGESIERQQGSLRLLVLILLAALLSNTAQFWVNGSSQFGGLSGVVYAYLGYTWLWDRRHPEAALGLTPGLMAMMLGWMLLGMTPLAASLGLNMANEAHLGGLLTGLAFALLPWPTPPTSTTRNSSP